MYELNACFDMLKIITKKYIIFYGYLYIVTMLHLNLFFVDIYNILHFFIKKNQIVHVEHETKKEKKTLFHGS